MAALEMAVVLPVGGRHEHLRRALAALAASGAELEVIVVDLLGDGEARRVASDVDSWRTSDAADGHRPSGRSGGLRLRHAACPPGQDGALRLAAARNTGAAMASFELLCFLDVDALVAAGAPTAWRTALHAFDHALLSPPVRYLEPCWDATIDQTSPVGGPAWVGHSAPAARPTPEWDRVATTDEYDLFWSVAFCCTRATFDRIGGFDETYVGYGAEDTDFAWRARQLHVPMVWLSAGTVYHQHHAPTREQPEAVAQLVQNASRFHATWGEWPMRGWLEELEARDVIDWDHTGGRLRLRHGSNGP